LIKSRRSLSIKLFKRYDHLNHRIRKGETILRGNPRFFIHYVLETMFPQDVKNISNLKREKTK